MIKHNQRWLVFVAVLSLALPGVGRAQEDEGRLQVVASYSILADVTSNVAGDVADVATLMPLSASPHGYIPTPQDLVTLVEADVVFMVGANFEEGLMESIENAQEDVNFVVVSNCIEIQPFGVHEHEGEEMYAGEEHEHEGEIAELCVVHHAELEGMHEEYEEHEGEAHEHEPEHVRSLGMLYTIDCGGGYEPEGKDAGEHVHEYENCDPHVWTDPYNAMLWTLMIRDTLSELDPANAETYAANAAAYVEELDTLLDQIAPLIETIPEENRKLVTNHLVYGYYANRFGLEMVGAVIPSASTLAEPSAAQIAELIDTIKEQAVPAVFADSTANPDLAQQVADETGAEFHKLYTGSLTDTDGPAPTYIDYILLNTQIIVEALGGTAD